MSFASADTKKNVIEMIDKTQKRIQNLNPTPCFGCQTVSPPPVEKSCVENICGATTPENSLIKALEVVYGGVKAETENLPELAKRIKELIQKIENEKSPITEKFSEALDIAKTSDETFSKPYQIIFSNIGFFAAHSSKVKFDPVIVNDVLVDMKMDKDQSRKLLSELSDEDFNWVSETMISLVKDSLTKKGQFYMDIRSVPPGVYLQNMHPEFSLDQNIKLEVAKLKANIGMIQKQSPLLQQVLGVDALPSMLGAIESAENGTIGETQLRSVITFNDEFESKNSMFGNRPDNPFLKRKTPSYRSVIGSLKSKEVILNELKANTESSLQRKKIKNEKCFSEYLLNRQNLPSVEQIRETQKDILLAKELIKSNVLNGYSTQTRRSLNTVVDALKFSLPPSREEMEKSMIDLLETMLRARDSGDKLINQLSLDETTGVAVIMIQFSKQEKEQQSKADETGSSTGSWCDGYQYQPLSDANYTSFGAIQTSYSVVKANQDIRLGILMHEIGHSLFKELDSKKGMSEESLGHFDAQKSCLENQHGEPLPLPPVEQSSMARTEHLQRFTDEDYSDMVSAIAGSSRYLSNPFCILQMSEIGGDFVDGEFSPIRGDTHSSSLYRLLHYQAMMKKTLPQNCQEIARKNNTQFQPCMTEK